MIVGLFVGLWGGIISFTSDVFAQIKDYLFFLRKKSQIYSYKFADLF